MATVTIGGRELAVWNRKDDGSLGKVRRAVAAEKALQEAEGDAAFTAYAELIRCYVGENEGVTVDWLLDVLPADGADLLRACVAATGAKSAEGEAKSP